MDADQRFIALRGHTLLCLQGFRGEGYSAEFVDNLAAIHETLRQHPERLVKVVEEPDRVCQACPHHAMAACQLNGEQSEIAMRNQDHTVLMRLGLHPGQEVPWQDILDRIRDQVSGADLPDICGRCHWLPLGYCREGIEALKSGSPPSLPPPSLIVPTRRTVQGA